MAGKPAFQFYPGDWLKDPALRMCSPATRGIWVDLLCGMWNGRTGWDIEGTLTGHARLCACTEAEMTTAIAELERLDVAIVERLGEGMIRVESRRLRRDAENRGKEADKKRRQRSSMSPSCPDDVPTHVPALSEVEEEERRRDKKRGGAGGEKPPAPKNEPWQIAMYRESTGRAPAIGYWPAITSQVQRRDVWEIALHRADTEGWKDGNVNARVKEYLDTERTMYPPEKRTNGHAVEAPRRRVANSDDPEVLKAAGLIRI